METKLTYEERLALVEDISRIRERGRKADEVSKALGGELDTAQVFQVTLSLDAGLPVEDIALYADPAYDWQQMKELYFAQASPETRPFAGLIADPGYCWGQMRELRHCLLDDATRPFAGLIADPAFDEEQMHELRFCFEEPRVRPYAHALADPARSAGQIAGARLFIESGVIPAWVEERMREQWRPRREPRTVAGEAARAKAKASALAQTASKARCAQAQGRKDAPRTGRSLR